MCSMKNAMGYINWKKITKVKSNWSPGWSSRSPVGSSGYFILCVPIRFTEEAAFKEPITVSQSIGIIIKQKTEVKTGVVLINNVEMLLEQPKLQNISVQHIFIKITVKGIGDFYILEDYFNDTF